MPGQMKQDSKSGSNELQSLLDFVDGKGSEDGVDRYSLVFTEDESGGIKLGVLADDTYGDDARVVETQSAAELRQAMHEWQRLFFHETVLSRDLELSAERVAEDPEIIELRQRLYPSLKPARRLPGAVSDEEAESSGEVVVHKGVELGCLVSLDEDIYDGAHVPPRVYVFEEFDSEAPAEANCTLINRANGDWTVRGIGELVPVDEVDTES